MNVSDRMILKNTYVLNEEFRFVQKDIEIINNKISGIGAFSANHEIDLSEKYIVPGFIDIHIHGAKGADTCDGSKVAFETIKKFLKGKGVISFLPTTMTYDIPRLLNVCKAFKDFKTENPFVALGISLEGPFISKTKKGAQNEEYIINPEIELFKRLYDACEGNIKLVTIAPELPGAIEFIKEASKLCKISLGHTQADYDTAMRAFESGASHVTHLFNAMNPLLHREPGIVGAALVSDATVELICDGIHIHPSVIKMVFSAFKKDKVVLVSDALRAAGLQDGHYDLGGQMTIVEKGKARLEDGTIAGSTTNLLDCVKNAVKFGVSLEDAIRAVTSNPANAIGINNKGIIKVGNDAKILVLDKQLNIVSIID